jgi:hypothetical protein
MSKSLSDREKDLIRKAYLIGQNDMFVELDWEKVYVIVGRAMEGGSAPVSTQAADAGADPEGAEGVAAPS